MASIRLAVDKEIAAKKLVVREDKDMYAGKSRTGTQRRETDPHRSVCVAVLVNRFEALTPPSPCRAAHADLNLREAFIELLFSYQLPWLQLGLEVVLGIDEICKTAKKDGQLVRLSTAHVLRKLIVQVCIQPCVMQLQVDVSSPDYSLCWHCSAC